MKRVIFSSMIVVGAMLVVLGVASKAGANFNEHCEHCHTPTPTPTHTPRPTQTPTPTPTPTPIPTQKPEETLVPTPTPAPVCTLNCPGDPNPGPANYRFSTTDAPPAAVCNIPFAAPILQGFTVNGKGSVTFSWWKSTASGISKQSIRYGYSPEKLVYGADNLSSDATSLKIDFLKPGEHVWAIVTAWKDGCAQDSNLLDPVVE